MLTPSRFSGCSADFLTKYGQPSCGINSARSHLHCSMLQAMQCTISSLPEFVPQQISEITEEEGLQMASLMQRCSIDVPSLGSVETAYVEQGAHSADKLAIVLLHGFDGSLLEHRRLLPLLSRAMHVFAVDLIGWGFTCSKRFDAQPDLPLSPQQKSDHLYAFWKEKVTITLSFILLNMSLSCWPF